MRPSIFWNLHPFSPVHNVRMKNKAQRVLVNFFSSSPCKATSKKRLQPPTEPSLNLPFPTKFELIFSDRNEAWLQEKTFLNPWWIKIRQYSPTEIEKCEKINAKQCVELEKSVVNGILHNNLNSSKSNFNYKGSTNKITVTNREIINSIGETRSEIQLY